MSTKGTMRWKATVIAVSVAGLLAVGASSTSARPNATVTLRIMTPEAGRPAIEIMIANFQRVYRNIKIDSQYAPSDALRPLLLTQLQAGNAPDVFEVEGGRGLFGVWPLAQAGRLLDMTGRKWNKRIYAPAKPNMSWNGKIYAWPTIVVPFGVLYNVDLFNQLGLKVPTRFSELLSMCRKITDAGKIPFVQSFSTTPGASIVGQQAYAAQVYGVDAAWNDKRAKKQVNFASSPLWHRALQSLLDMKDAGCFQEAPQGTSRAQQYQILARGDAVMSMVVSLEIQNFLTVNPNLKYRMFSLPSDDPRKTVAYAKPDIALAGNAVTKYPKEVRTFIDFVAREKQSSLFAKVSGAFSPLDAKKGIVPLYLKQDMGPLFTAGKVVGGVNEVWPNSSVFNDGYVPGILGLFTGQTTVDGILARMDQAWDT